MKLSLDNKILFNRCEYIFWDFDGVIKESLEVKSNAFFKLFEKFGHDIASKVRNHHEDNVNYLGGSGRGIKPKEAQYE